MKTREQLEHEAERQKRSDEINAGVLLLEWPDDVTRHSGDGGEGISDFYRSLESRDEEANTREGQAARKYENHTQQVIAQAVEGGLSPELDEVERNRREDEKERIEKEFYENERSRAATADNYWNEELDYE